ncbi:hypothetical protein Btru_065382 [Bulinus truncatus]|nr:hypothetical protein Btru_065382 [Bulinus truncatus]
MFGASTRKSRVYSAFAVFVLASFSILLYAIDSRPVAGGGGGDFVKDEAMFLKVVRELSSPRSNISQLCQSGVYIRCQQSVARDATRAEPSGQQTEEGEGHLQESNGYYRIRLKKERKSPLRVTIINLSHYFKDELRLAQGLCSDECDFSTEQVTEETDVVLAVASALSDQQIPKTRWPGQVYVIFSMEAPVNWMSYINTGQCSLVREPGTCCEEFLHLVITTGDSVELWSTSCKLLVAP